MRLAGKLTTVLVVCILVLVTMAEYSILRHQNEQMGRKCAATRTSWDADCSRSSTNSGGRPVRPEPERSWTDQPSGGRTVGASGLFGCGSWRSPIALEFPRLVAFRASGFHHSQLRQHGQEHLFTYARFSLKVARRRSNWPNQSRHKQENSSYFMVHAAMLMLCTALLGGVLVVALGSPGSAVRLRKLIDKTRRDRTR